jgi:hypothetical protein
MAEGNTTNEAPIGGPLILRRAKDRSSAVDYDVRWNGRDIGRIFNARHGVPADQPWMWTITGALVKPLPSYGFCASLEEAKAKFAEWRAWLARRSS